jgi:hypothetical protein
MWRSDGQSVFVGRAPPAAARAAARTSAPLFPSRASPSANMQRQVLAAARLVPLARRSALVAVAPARSMAATAAAPAAKSGGGLGSTVYQLVFRRNITYATYIFGAAIVLEVVYGSTLDGIWNAMNKGVRGAQRRAAAAHCGGTARRVLTTARVPPLSPARSAPLRARIGASSRWRTKRSKGRRASGER